MVKRLIGLMLVVLFLCPAFVSGLSEERPSGIIGKVTTEKGPLKLRSKPGDKGRVLDEIPNGTCLLVLSEGESWHEVQYQEQTGYCKAALITLFRDADASLLNYRILRKGDAGSDVLAMKKRLQELGYIRKGSELTDTYDDTMAGRVKLFQRQIEMTEDGIASQELQAYLFSDKAPACTQKLPQIRSRVASPDGAKKEICGCCMGEGCECCGNKGWIYCWD